MILRRLQDFIGDIYDVSIAHDVYDFLVTDRRHLPAAARNDDPTDEQLIVAQPEGTDGEIAMSLYLDPQLLERLHRADPMEPTKHVYEGMIILIAESNGILEQIIRK